MNSTVKKTKLNGDYAKRNVLFFVLFLITSSLIFVGGIEEQEKPSKLNAMTMQKEMLFFFFFLSLITLIVILRRSEYHMYSMIYMFRFLITKNLNLNKQIPSLIAI